MRLQKRWPRGVDLQQSGCKHLQLLSWLEDSARTW